MKKVCKTRFFITGLTGALLICCAAFALFFTGGGVSARADDVPITQSDFVLVLIGSDSDTDNDDYYGTVSIDDIGVNSGSGKMDTLGSLGGSLTLADFDYKYVAQDGLSVGFRPSYATYGTANLYVNIVSGQTIVMKVQFAVNVVRDIREIDTAKKKTVGIRQGITKELSVAALINDAESWYAEYELFDLNGANAGAQMTFAKNASTGKISATAKNPSENPFSAAATFKLKNDGRTRVFVLPFNFRADENPKPVLTINDAGDNTKKKVVVNKGNGDFTLNEKNALTLNTADLFDLNAKPDDNVRLLSVSNSGSAIADAEKTTDTKMTLTFRAKGEAVIKLTATDATGKAYAYQFTVLNEDLPALSFFNSIVHDIKTQPFVYLIGFLLFLFIVIILLGLLAASNRKKRMRAEVEALLISEMELEEQMTRLLPGQTQNVNPVTNFSYGYIPSQRQPFTQGFMPPQSDDPYRNDGGGFPGSDF